MKQAKKYPAPQISEAVFRGRNSLYNFEVYPMNVRFNEVPAVYIISRRKIDRHGKGHHFLVCIGQTESLVEDIKKHKRGRCVKQLQADTVSVILEDDEQKRLEVENDIKAAHTIPCRREAADAEFVFKPLEKIVPQQQQQQNVKTEPQETARSRAPKTEAAPAKLPKKPAQKQPEVNAEAEIQVSKPKRAKRNPVENKAKADSKTISQTPKKPGVEKKPSALKSKKTVQTDVKTVETKDKTKAQKAKTQKAEASKAKETPAKTGKIKADKKSPAKEAGVSQPKKINRAKVRIEKKQPVAKTVPALKKSSGNQIKPKAESKVEASKTKRGAQKINKAKAGKLKVNKTNTVRTPDKTAGKSIGAKPVKTVKPLKTKADNKTKTDNKTKNKVKISAGAKTESPQTGKAKAGADLKTAKPPEINRRTKASKTGKPEKANQRAEAKPSPAKAKGKAEAPKSAKPPRSNSGGGSNASPKVKANTKPEIGIKSSVKGKENRLKSSPRKRLAF